MVVQVVSGGGCFNLAGDCAREAVKSGIRKAGGGDKADR